jgi:hypothetical protein
LLNLREKLRRETIQRILAEVFIEDSQNDSHSFAVDFGRPKLAVFKPLLDFLFESPIFERDADKGIGRFGFDLFFEVEDESSCVGFSIKAPSDSFRAATSFVLELGFGCLS